MTEKIFQLKMVTRNAEITLFMLKKVNHLNMHTRSITERNLLLLDTKYFIHLIKRKRKM